jgi:uncharacterized protein (DUF2147 family)
MKWVESLVLAVAVVLSHTPADAGASPSSGAEARAEVLGADSILGNWWSEGKEGLLKVVKTKTGKYEVIILDGKNADAKDVKNPDPKLRNRKLRGLVIMWHLRFVDGEYVDGYCYNPEDGNTYRVKMKMTSKTTLDLRGYLAIPLLGKSQVWTRAS